MMALEFPPPQLISAQAGIRRGRTALRTNGALLFFWCVSLLSPRGFFAGRMRAKHAVEHSIDVAELALQVESVRQSFRI